MKKTAKNDKDKRFDEMDYSGNILLEFWEFIKDNKKFWMIPLIIILLLLGLLIFLGGSGAAPFIYTLF